MNIKALKNFKHGITAGLTIYAKYIHVSLHIYTYALCITKMYAYKKRRSPLLVLTCNTFATCPECASLFKAKNMSKS